MGTGFSKKKKEAKIMQQQFSRIQDQISTMEVTGSAAGGLVVIKLNGDNEMKSIKIKPECIDKDDLEGLEVLIKAAYADAQKQIKDQTSSAMPSIPKGLFG